MKGFIKGRRQGALPGEEFVELGWDFEEELEAARILTAVGYDALDVDAGTYDSWYWNHLPMYFGKKGIYLEFSCLVKQMVDVPVIVAGRMDDAEMAAGATARATWLHWGTRFWPMRTYPIKCTATSPICLSCHEGCMGRFTQVESFPAR